MNSAGSSDFSKTHWTTIGEALSSDPLLKHPALNKLAASYLRSLHRFLVDKKRIPEHDADEIVQDFLVEKLLRGQLLSGASREKGKFRARLVRAMENFLIDRRFRPAAGAPATFEFQDDWDGESRESLDHFNLEWAQERLEACLQRMRAECERKDRADLWQVFDERHIQKLLYGRPETPYEELQQRFGWKSRKQAADHLVTAQRMWARVVREEIAEFSEDPESVEEEIRELIDTLLEAARGGFTLASRPQSASPEPPSCEAGPAALIGIDEFSLENCSAADLARQLLQQLARPLAEDLGVVDSITGFQPPLTTFRDVLEHPQPPLPLLQLLRDFAKESMVAPRQSLSQPVAQFLYVAALLAAVANGESISTKSPVQIQLDAFVLQRQPWIPSEARALLQRLAAKILSLRA